MADKYSQLVNTTIGRSLVKRVGLPAPVPLRRYTPGQALIEGRVLLGGAPGGRLRETLRRLLAEVAVDVVEPPLAPDASNQALIFDATAVRDVQELRELYEFFHRSIRSLGSCGRVLIFGTPPAQAATPSQAIAQRALEGFARSLAKELRRGGTAQLVHVAEGGEGQLASTVRFLLSSRSAYVSGQVVRVGPAAPSPTLDWEKPMAGKVALVTGASRGIGAAIAATLARDGAHVVGLDVPTLASDLAAVTEALGGSALTLDITADDAPRAIAEHLRSEHQGVDAVIHNAGITRDKTLGRMDEGLWSSVIEVNLAAAQRITDALISDAASAVLNEGGRVVCVSSISGIAGNAGQSNYATSKAGVIGLVDAYAPLLAERGATINAVAPGFIETQMTAAMPLALREAGRRMNSLSQGGLPVDVAETIAWLAAPASGGLNGNVVRVCGQSLLGA
jgi:3-oxoacyl-[acyl-carrier protein] reductase